MFYYSTSGLCIRRTSLTCVYIIIKSAFPIDLKGKWKNQWLYHLQTHRRELSVLLQRHLKLHSPTTCRKALRSAGVGVWSWGVEALRKLYLPDAAHEQELCSSPEVVVQEEVDGRVHAAVEKSQAAGDEEPVAQPYAGFTAQVGVWEIANDSDGLESVVWQPGHPERHDDAEDHLQGVSATSLGSGVPGGDTVPVEVRDDGSVAEHDDQQWEDECEEHHGQIWEEHGIFIFLAGLTSLRWH